ncbi:MAG: dihydrodipicolinate synthase family protein [Planctomycetaceae bacterium]|nr:dihydrodipicolinate synthase family protein [Planctomycetaceae bacterium]
MSFDPLLGLIAATHTPFNADGSLAVHVVESQAASLAADGVQTVFICGTTGESHSLTVDERIRMTDRWCDVTAGTDMNVVVHVGANCLADATALAAHAAKRNVRAIAMLSPCYFKPGNVAALVSCCQQVAAAAPGVPFYFYDIPSMTNVQLSMPEFLQQAGTKIPTLAGLKFTNPDLMAWQKCRAVERGTSGLPYDLLWGVDEMLLAALSFGARGAVGSTYNFAAPLYHRIIQSFRAGDFDAAQQDQLLSVQLVDVLVHRGYMSSAKSLMGRLNVPVGGPRLPMVPLSSQVADELWEELQPLLPKFRKN